MKKPFCILFLVLISASLGAAEAGDPKKALRDFMPLTRMPQPIWRLIAGYANRVVELDCAAMIDKWVVDEQKRGARMDFTQRLKERLHYVRKIIAYEAMLWKDKLAIDLWVIFSGKENKGFTCRLNYDLNTHAVKIDAFARRETTQIPVEHHGLRILKRDSDLELQTITRSPHFGPIDTNQIITVNQTNDYDFEEFFGLKSSAAASGAGAGQ